MISGAVPKTRDFCVAFRDLRKVRQTADHQKSGVHNPAERNVMSLKSIVNSDHGDELSRLHDHTAIESNQASVYNELSGVSLLGELCSKRNCYRDACPLYGSFCEFHKPSRLCKVPECRKCAKTGGYCISHGGGRRCEFTNCAKSAKEGGLCISHGGGKRCQGEGCERAAVRGGLCSSHGAGARPN